MFANEADAKCECGHIAMQHAKGHGRCRAEPLAKYVDGKAAEFDCPCEAFERAGKTACVCCDPEGLRAFYVMYERARNSPDATPVELGAYFIEGLCAKHFKLIDEMHVEIGKALRRSPHSPTMLSAVCD